MEPITLTVSSQGQVTIPKPWRKLLNLKPGIKLAAEISKGLRSKKIILEPEPESWARYVAGIGKGLWGKNSEVYHRRWKKEWARRK